MGDSNRWPKLPVVQTTLTMSVLLNRIGRTRKYKTGRWATQSELDWGVLDIDTEGDLLGISAWPVLMGIGLQTRPLSLFLGDEQRWIAEGKYPVLGDLLSFLLNQIPLTAYSGLMYSDLVGVFYSDLDETLKRRIEESDVLVYKFNSPSFYRGQLGLTGG